MKQNVETLKDAYVRLATSIVTSIAVISILFLVDTSDKPLAAFVLTIAIFGSLIETQRNFDHCYELRHAESMHEIG